MGLVPDDLQPLVRTLVAGIVAYAMLVAVIRVSGKRTLSQMNAFDLIVTVALGSTLATVIVSNSVTVLQGVLALGLLVALQYAITWTSVRWDRFAGLVKSEPRALVFRGRALRAAMRDERVLETELLAVLRAAGHPGIDAVDLVVLETDGSFSVVATLPGNAEIATGLRVDGGDGDGGR